MLAENEWVELLELLDYYDGLGTHYNDVLANSQVRTAVRKFQTDAGLVADGVYGPKTDLALSDLQSKLLHHGDLIPRCRYPRFKLTRYYVVCEEDYPGDVQVPLLDIYGQAIAAVSPAFFAHAALEGTGRLRDGRLVNVAGGQRISPEHPTIFQPVLNYARKVLAGHVEYAGVTPDAGGHVRVVTPFVLVTNLGAGYGMVHGFPYRPFRTLAADIGAYPACDQRYIGKGGLVPLGTKVFIPEFVGRLLPDDTVHDGWCLVHDTGSAIVRNHFDVFCGPESWARRVAGRQTGIWAQRQALPGVGHVWFEIRAADDELLDTAARRIPFYYDSVL